jgi:hypothetical protein
MVYRFNTGMQRVVVLRDLRAGVFPSDYDMIRFADQFVVIKDLINPDPKDRPSSLNALKNPLIPVPKEESVDVLGVLRKKLNHKDSSNFITPFFEIESENYQDFTFDYNSGLERYDPFLVQGVAKVREVMVSFLIRYLIYLLRLNYFYCRVR